MEPPWLSSRIGILRNPDLVHPSLAPGDWDGVEDYLGLQLPSDYKDLIGDGRALVLDEELVVASPWDPNQYLNLLSVVTESAATEAHLRHEWIEAGWPRQEYLDPVYPEPGGAVGWGTDSNGGHYHWDTGAPSPDDWTVIVTERALDVPARYDLTVTAYLDGLRTGAVLPATYESEDWPRPGAGLVRYPLQ